jgi:hypothetical protein
MTADGTVCRDVSDDSTTEDGEVDASRKRNIDNVTCRLDSTSKQFCEPDGTSKRMKLSTGIGEVSIECPDSVASQDICDDCRALNLDVLIRILNEPDHMEKQLPAPWYRFNSSREGPRAPIGHRYKSAQNSSCVICRILAKSRLYGGCNDGNDGLRNENTDYEICLRDFGSAPFLGSTRRPSTKAMHLIIVPQSLRDFTRIDRHIVSEGCAVLLLQSVSRDLFTPKAIPGVFNADLVGSWIRYCASNHKSFCDKDTLPVLGVRVIDCVTRHIVDWDGNAPYVSLSYVWGTDKDTCGAIETVEGRQTLPQLLPCVIKDSIEVTKVLGYRYLWVDKFCIAQDSPDLKHEQIQQMDAVYHNSDLTIISAAGVDESYGLPGVGTTCRSLQLIANLDGASVLYAPKDPQEAIKQSHWSTRGWTFQEAVLSRRRLVFTEDQIYFQCDTMNCFESVHCPLDELHKPRYLIRSGLFGMIRGHEHRNVARDYQKHSLHDSVCLYRSNVEDYTSRTLRFAADSLNAFQGILRRFSQRQGLDNLWGLAYPTNCSDSLTFFVHALAWTHQTGTIPQRRSMFPSWAWAGWEGPITYKIIGYSNLDFNILVHELRFRTATGRLVEFEDLNGKDHHPIVQVKATTVSSSHIAYRPKKSSDEPWRVFGCSARLSLSSGGSRDGDFLQSLQDESQWQCIIIGHISHETFIMVMRARPDRITWERAGMFYVLLDWNSHIVQQLHKDQVVRTFEIS